MKAIIAHTPALHDPAEAERLAAYLNADEAEAGDGWTYRARHDPTGRGRSLIDIFDEAGELVGQL
ncbi:MAG TPA: hypothetical protein VFX29_05520 [Longimicrobiaceae bacterium]|nr:hypothetical protein [Longimicrobiaceae bacterium]